MKTDFFKQQIIYQLVIGSKVLDKEVLFDTETGGYCYFEVLEGVAHYTPLSAINKPRPISEVPLTAFSVKEIENGKSEIDRYVSEKIGQLSDIYGENNGVLSENNQSNIGIISETDQNNTRIKLDKKGNLVGNSSGNDKYLFGTMTEKLSGIYQNETRELLEKIEILSDKMLRGTDKKQTIDKIVSDYKQAVKFANKQELDGILSLHKKAITRFGRIKNRKTQNKIDGKRIVFKRKVKIFLWTTLIILIFSVSLFLYLRYGINTNFNPTLPTEELWINTATKSEITQAIDQFTSENDTTLTAWRVNFITEKLEGKKLTNKELYNQIEILSIYK